MLKTKILLMAAIPLITSSCIVMEQHHVTGNPIGTKVGYVESKLVGNFDAGIGAAAKQGKITKIGSVDVKLTSFGKIKVTVTGE